ncbi:MAG: ferrous iron transporter B [Dehalococcoidia bacterium]|nr:ferrous iron transporter B [Dehalococcoidia bacterium]
MRVLLMGNPNVGKSVVFSRLTGVRVMSSNYPGTTVNYTEGRMKVGDEEAQVIDVPGSYTLDPTCEAEEVAVRMLELGDVVINVVDATNLERNLFLTLQLIERKVPVVVALNMWDDTRHRGITIDLEKLHEELGVPVIPTVAVSGQGIKELVESLPDAVAGSHPERTREERWAAVGHVTDSVQVISHRHHTWLERLSDATVKPVQGGAIALGVLVLSFAAIRMIGESLIRWVIDPAYETLWMPVVQRVSDSLGADGVLHAVLIGRVSGGTIDPVESFGLLSSGVYVPLAMVLPYIVSFYLILGLMEDVGYLPRLAVLLDSAMHRLGLHGYAIIPTLLGLGCNVPAVLATRILESRRERFIAATLVAVAVPCASLQAVVLGLVGNFGYRYVLIVYGTLLLVWLILGTILNRMMKGFSPELLIEIPRYRWPLFEPVCAKLWGRVRGFLREALPVFLVAILAINLLYLAGAFDAIARIAAPVVTQLLGLPPEAVVALLVGFLRKDVALGLLAPLSLTAGQYVVAAVVLAMFFPCVATFAVMFRELGAKDTAKSAAVMLVSALSVGAILNAIL